jgi:hypothetical protein
MTLRPGQHPPLDELRQQMTPREFRALFLEFGAPSWRAWNSVEDVVFGAAPDDPALVRRLTGRTTLPTTQVAEVWPIVGRGGGKSRWDARLACYVACGREYPRVPGEFIYVGIFAPDKKQSGLTFRYVRGLLHSVPALRALIVRETTDSIELSTGVVIEVITANTAAPRGRAYALAIIEEAAFLPTDEHGAEQDRELLRALRPALARVPGSLLVPTSSPYAMRGEVYRTYEERYGKDDPDVLVVLADTLTMNPSFSRREVERAFREDPTSARAEYGRDGVIEFRTDVAEFFGAGLAECVATGVCERAPDGTRETKFHMDTATGSGEDDAVIAGAWCDEQGRSVQVVQRRWSPPFSPLSVVEEASALLARYGASDVQVDRFAAGVFVDMFAARGITCTVAERDTSQMFLELLALVNSGRVVLLDDPTLVAQLRGLERRTRSGGRDAVGHRPRGHDDVAAACAGALVLAAGESATQCEYCPPGSGCAGLHLLTPGMVPWRERQRAAAAPTSDERRALLPLVEALGRAIDLNDEAATADARLAIETHVLRVEQGDPDAGQRLRSLVATVERLIEDHTGASA